MFLVHKLRVVVGNDTLAVCNNSLHQDKHKL